MWHHTTLRQVNPTTGNLTKLGHGAQNELNAQGLACIDHKRAIYYVLDFNDTSRVPAPSSAELWFLHMCGVGTIAHAPFVFD